MNPLVSILIPAYNAERWIAETIRSGLAQTWSRKELIIVDDGSTDETLALARQFESAEVKIVTQENQGGCVARNRAYELSQGDYIQWLDADDLLAPDKIECQVRACSDFDDRVLLSSSWNYFMHRPEKRDSKRSSLWCDLPPVEWMIRKLEGRDFMTNSAWLVSRRLTEAAGPWDVRLHKDQDGEYFARVMARSTMVRFIPDAWMFYRRSGADSTSNLSGSDRKLESQLLSIKLQINYLRALEDSPRVHAACVQFLQTWYVFFLADRPDIAAEMEELALEFGGRLTLPSLGWKYDWLARVVGWKRAKRVQESYNRGKFNLVSSLEKIRHPREERVNKNGGRRESVLHGDRAPKSTGGDDE